MTTSGPDGDPPRVVGSEPVYSGRVLNLRVDELEPASGATFKREVVEHAAAVVIVPVDGDGLLLWVRQYRHAAGRTLLELPAGTLEDDEAPEAGARRELAEETGQAAAAWQRLGSFFTAPGFCTEYMHAFAASELTPALATPDEDEEIEVVLLTLEESLRLIDSGEVEDAKSIAAVHLYLRKRRPRAAPSRVLKNGKPHPSRASG